MQLYDAQGQRLFIDADERARFLASADLCEPKVRTFCRVMVFTGCRVSEALALTPGHVHLTDRCVSVVCLKKRGKHLVREIPLPDALILLLDEVHAIQRTARGADVVAQVSPLWPWSRSTAWRIVKGVMADAGISGMCACPKGLRHGFGRQAVAAGVQLHLLQKWMGHADIKTTAIYANTTSAEERSIAEKMW